MPVDSSGCDAWFLSGQAALLIENGDAIKVRSLELSSVLIVSGIAGRHDVIAKIIVFVPKSL